jgi:hypothetical protein
MKIRAILPLALFLAACTAQPPEVPDQSSSTSSSAAMTQALMLTYTDPQAGFSIQYPEGWTVEQNASLPPLNRISSGVAFVPPNSLTGGSSWIDGMVFVEKTPGACPEFARVDVKTLGENEYLHGSSSDAGAGNLYLIDLYSTAKGQNCFGITLYRHLCNLGPDCGEAHAKPFDDAEVQASLRTMLASFRSL